MPTARLVCPQCNDEYPQHATYCTSCGTELEQVEPAAGTTEPEESSDPESDPAATALTRLGWFSLLLTLTTGYLGAALLYASRVGYRTGYGRMQTSYSLVYAIDGTTYSIPLAAVYLPIAVIFGLLGIAAIKRMPRIWIAALGWYGVILFVALAPPPTLWVIPIAILGLYWAYRGRTYTPPPSTEMEPGTDQSTHPTQEPSSGHGSIPVAILWMMVVSLLLFWLPVLGPIIAGYVGGKKAGGAFKGFTAAAFPALLIGGILFVVGTAQNLPVIGALLGGAAMLYVLLHTATLVVGALIGGTLA